MAGRQPTARSLPATSWHRTHTVRSRSPSSLEITEIAPDILDGYSPALDLLIRWDHGQLEWLDPATGAPIPSWDDADTRLRELEDENRRLREQLADSSNR